MTATPTRRLVGATSVIVGVVLMALGAATGSAQAASVTPTPFDGNPDCADLGYANGFKIDDINDLPAEGDYTSSTPDTASEGTLPAGFTITLDNVEVTGGVAEFDWAASADPDSTPVLIDVVLVKSGSGGNQYTYNPPVSADTDLVSPNDSLSHIIFCWDDDTGTDGTTDDATDGTTDDATDGTTDDATDGTTDDATDGTTDDATDGTTDDATDGTTDDATDGTTDDSTDGTTDEGDVGATDTEQDTTTDGTEVGGVVVPAAQELPRTGDNDVSLFILGVALISLGGGILLIRRDLFVRS